MKIKSILVLLFVSTVLSDSLYGQKVPLDKDSIKLYKDIQTFSKRSRFTEFMYQLIFKPVATKPSNKEIIKKPFQKSVRNKYKAFEGKIIRHINIVTLDPFGYSIKEDEIDPQNILFKIGNKLHIKSQHVTIRNLLLIHQNQIFDSLLVKESERLVRSQQYVHEVSFQFKSVSQSKDSVDIFIRELDNWSIIPELAFSSSRISIDLTDKNILGFGHEFQNAIAWNHTNGKYAFNTSYFIPNIRNTYISSMLHYDLDEFKNFNKSFNIERPFYSPLSRWAAGIFLAQQFKSDSINYRNQGYQPVKFKYNTQDFWGGTAWQIFKGKTEDERTTNLILAARYLGIRYVLKPDQLYDSLHNYSNENLFMLAIGISTRKYRQDRFIFKHGIIEDVPIGKVYGITGGYQIKNSVSRYYLGLRYSVGDYKELGYFGTNLEYGTYFRGTNAEQGVLIAGINYFTNLIELRKWRIRQFVRPELTIGFNRFSTDSLTLKNDYGLNGFNSSGLTGTNRLIISFQTQSYAPWNFIGFHFGPYFSYSLGLLGDDRTDFKMSRLYSQIVLGVLIKNENLVFNTFQISLSYYPVIPGDGLDIYKFNSFQTTDFGFRDFEIGKPSAILYR